MHWGSALAIYFVIWWTVLFISLPFRMRSQIENGEVTDGTEPAAPANPRLVLRMLVNTVLAGIVFGLFYLVFYVWDVSVSDLPRVVPQGGVLR